MKTFPFPLLILCLWASTLTAQPANIAVNPSYEKAPRKVARSPQKLAEYLTQDESSDDQKALNIYTWMANNIKYDLKALKKVKTKSYSPKQTLKRKKGICYQYSSLFATLCQHADISAKEIIGYSRGATYQEDDPFYESDHSWNGIKLGTTWHLVEPTWGSGYIVPKKQWFRELLFRLFKKPYIANRFKFIQHPNYGYFLVSPESLLSDHLPADPTWQLVEYPISVNTFESKDWISYTARMDSSYQRRVDAMEYIRELDRYESMTELRFLQERGEKSHGFNPKNTRLLGVSMLHTAKSYENSSEELTEKLEGYQEAKRLYTSGSKELRRHQKTATTEWNKTTKISRAKIRATLNMPLSKRIAQSKGHAKAASRLQYKAKKGQKRQVSQIAKWDRIMSTESRPFKQPSPRASTNMEMVEQNTSTIEAHLIRIATDQDSVAMLMQQIESLSHARDFFLAETFEQYETMESLSWTNIYASMMSNSISIISESMHRIDSVGGIIEELNNHRKELGRVRLQRKNKIKRHHASILSLSSKVQRLVLQNCKLSSNQSCDRSLYEASNQTIESVYHTKIKLEERFLARAKQAHRKAKELKQKLKDVLNTLDLNAACIAAYKAARIDGIRSKLRKSKYETGKFIRVGQQGIRNANSAISVLKAEMKKNQRAGMGSESNH